MKSLRDSDFQFKKEGLLDPGKIDKYGNTTSYKLYEALIKLDCMEQRHRILARQANESRTDRACLTYSANAYSHAFDIVCSILNIFKRDERDHTKPDWNYHTKKPRKIKKYKSREWLKSQIDGGAKVEEVADFCRVHPQTINNYLRIFGIKKGREEK